MTLQQFIAKWYGQRIDYDKVFQYQCVDLILQYLKEVHDVTGVNGNAKEYWLSPSPILLEKFDKKQDIQAGDIVILKPTDSNVFGHIGIATDSTTMLEQNGLGTGSGLGHDAVRYRTIPISRVYGVLRRKGERMEEGRVFEELNKRDKRMDSLEKSIGDLYKIVDEINKKLGSTPVLSDGLYEIKKKG